MQSLGFHDKNPMMFEMMLKMSAKRKGGSTTFVQFAEDLALLIVSIAQATSKMAKTLTSKYSLEL